MQLKTFHWLNHHGMHEPLYHAVQILVTVHIISLVISIFILV